MRRQGFQGLGTWIFGFRISAVGREDLPGFGVEGLVPLCSLWRTFRSSGFNS